MRAALALAALAATAEALTTSCKWSTPGSS
jgi:hypothetical protein